MNQGELTVEDADETSTETRGKNQVEFSGTGETERMGMKWELWLKLLSSIILFLIPLVAWARAGVCSGSARDGALVFGFPDELGDFCTSISILRTALLPQSAWRIALNCAAAVKAHGRHWWLLQGLRFRARRLISGWNGGTRALFPASLSF